MDKGFGRDSLLFLEVETVYCAMRESFQGISDYTNRVWLRFVYMSAVEAKQITILSGE